MPPVVFLLAQTFVDTSPLHSGGPIDDRINFIYTWVFWASVVVGVLVSGLILYSAFRFRRKYDDEEPEQVHGHNKLELTWTIVPFVILFALFLLTAANMSYINDQPANSYMHVHVIGEQFDWRFEYPYTTSAGKKFQKSTILTIPADQPVALDLDSRDVAHSFYVPALAGQMNAIPGQTNTMWIQARAGKYYGQCTELCGTGHAQMLVEIDALPMDKYQAWLQQQGINVAG